ncbi:S9 family peptidase, partial [Streptomonospora algeriensis]
PAGADSRLGESADLTPEPGMALYGHGRDFTPDGTIVVTAWSVYAGRGVRRDHLVAVDTATGERRVLAADSEHDFGGPAVSPDGRSVVAVRDFPGGEGPHGRAPEATLWLVDLATGEGRDLLAGYDLWPRDYAWTADSSAVLFAADDQGRRPVFRVEAATGALVRVTADDGGYSDLNPAPAGTGLFALRDSWDEPPTPVRIDDATGAAGPQHPVRLSAPEEPLEVPGALTEVAAEADDGMRIRSWLVLLRRDSAVHYE